MSRGKGYEVRWEGGKIVRIDPTSKGQRRLELAKKLTRYTGMPLLFTAKLVVKACDLVGGVGYDASAQLGVSTRKFGLPIVAAVGIAAAVPVIKTATASPSVLSQTKQKEEHALLPVVTYVPTTRPLPIPQLADIEFSDYWYELVTRPVSCMVLPAGTEHCTSEPILASLTDAESVIRDNIEYAKYLLQVELDKGMPAYSLVVSALIESQMGKLNVCNKHGYCGAFQFGKNEWGKYGKKYSSNIFDKEAQAQAAADLQINYAGIYNAPLKDNYLLHQQGAKGLLIGRKLAAGEAVDYYTKIKIIHNLANNLPKKYQKGLVVKRKVVTKNRNGKIRTSVRWVPANGRTAQDVAVTFFAVWDHEQKRLYSSAEKVLSTHYAKLKDKSDVNNTTIS